MKKKLNRLIMVNGGFLLLVLILWACNNEKEQTVSTELGKTSPPPSDIATWINDLATQYRNDIQQRITNLENDSVGNKLVPTPVRTEYAQEYLSSYRNRTVGSRANCNTLAVSITDKELAYFINYLYENRNTPGFSKKLQFAFGIYDISLPNGSADPDLAKCPGRNGRTTLIVGVAPDSTIDCKSKPDCNIKTYIHPFRDKKLSSKKEPGDSVSFYDDWHELWP